MLKQADAQLGADSIARYDTAIKYLLDNKDELKSEWLKLFKGNNRKNEKLRMKNGFNFKVSPVICFLPILVFSEMPNADSITSHSMTELREPQLYAQRYSFESFTSYDLLKKGIADTSGVQPLNSFVVTFSKPFQNYVIAEFTLHHGRLKRCDATIRGRTMWVLFTFSSALSIDKVYYCYLDR